MRITEILEGAPPRKFNANQPLGDAWEIKIRQDCSDVLGVYKATGQFLYRGVNERAIGHSMFQGRSMPGREPVDNSHENQELFDEMLEACGCEALRSNSIFCTGETELAAQYGDVFAIFPINGFKFTWTDFGDLQYMDEEIPNWPIKDVEQFKRVVKPRNDDLSQALANGVEVYVKGSYYAIKFFKNEEQLRNLVNQN